MRTKFIGLSLSDWKTRNIHSTNRNSGTWCQMVWSNAYSPMDIHAFEPRRQLPRPGKFNFSLIVVILLLNGILNRAGSSVKSSFYFL